MKILTQINYTAYNEVLRTEDFGYCRGVNFMAIVN